MTLDPAILPLAAFHWAVDGSIVLLYLAGSIFAGLVVRHYVRRVDDFLLAGRKVNLHLGIASLAATEFGIATCMANAQLGYNYGFAGITPGIALALAMFVVGATGFCISPLRKSGAMTVPEMFENRYGPRVRQLSGVVIVLGGLLNMGVFLRQAGEFLVLVCGLPPGLLEITMTVLLVCVAVYTILGGMLSVLVTDFIQFVVMSIGLLIVTGLVFSLLGWPGMIASVDARHGAAGFNPFHTAPDGTALYGIQRIILDLLVAFSAVLTWQTMISRVLSSRDERVGRKIYTGTSAFFLVRFTIPALWGISAAALITPATLEALGDESTLAMPTLLAHIVPIGILGLVVASMLAADMSTNSSYMLAWSSVIFNDILRPLRRKPMSERQGLVLNRSLVALIGVFLLMYGLWYPLKGDLWVYLQITGSIYLASMSVLMIAACYWKRASKTGAVATIIIGATIPVTFLILQQIESTASFAERIGPYYAGIATYIAAALAMIVGSMLKPGKHPYL